MKHPDLRRIFEVVIAPALLLAAIALPIPLLGDRLPHPLAIHWSFDGTPDGSMPRILFWLAVTGVSIVAWAILIARSRRPAAISGARLPEAVPVLGGGGFLAGVMAVTVLANDGADTWEHADHVGPMTVLAVIAFGLACVGAALLLERGRPRTAADATVAAPATVGLGTGERAVWVGRASSPVLAVVGVATGLALAAGGIVAPGSAAPALLIGAALVTVVVVWLATVRVTVSDRGVRVGFGPLGAPAKRIALDEVTAAEATRIDPMRWGGWGYRWAGPGRTAVVLRAGDGLVLDLRGGGRFAVTVDDPEEAAGLLNDLVRRRDAPT